MCQLFWGYIISSTHGFLVLWSTLEYSGSENTLQYITYTVSSDIATGGFTQEFKNNLLGKLAI